MSTLYRLADLLEADTPARLIPEQSLLGRHTFANGRGASIIRDLNCPTRYEIAELAADSFDGFAKDDDGDTVIVADLTGAQAIRLARRISLDDAVYF